MATTVFPAEELVRVRLASGAKVVQQASAFHPYLAAQLAGKELDGRGVHVALTMALHHYQVQQQPDPLYFTLLKDAMPSVVMTVVEDPQVRQEALEAVKRIGF